jgi:hypothetical protein
MTRPGNPAQSAAAEPCRQIVCAKPKQNAAPFVFSGLEGTKMERSMNTKIKALAAAAVLAGAAVAVSGTPAAARLVCNYYGDCWHVDGHYGWYGRYGRGYYRYYGDDWYRHHRWDRDRWWRDGRYGRDYYRNHWWGF